MKTKQSFKPTQEMVSAVNATFLAMAVVGTIKPIVNEYQQKILDYEKYEYEEKQLKRRGKTSLDWIKDIKDAWLMSDKDFKHYSNRCNEERIKAKLHVDDPEWCPLLIVEDLLRQAENLLLDSMKPITGFDSQEILCNRNGLENRKKLLDLTLKLLAPFAKNTL